MKKIALVLFTFALLAIPAIALAEAQPSPCLQNPSSSQCQAASYGSVDSNNPIVKDINTLVNFLSGAVAIAVVAMLMVGGIQYMIAGDNPQAVAAARGRITHALIALLAFAFTFAFLQWLIPGGIFK